MKKMEGKKKFPCNNGLLIPDQAKFLSRRQLHRSRRACRRSAGRRLQFFGRTATTSGVGFRRYTAAVGYMCGRQQWAYCGELRGSSSPVWLQLRIPSPRFMNTRHRSVLLYVHRDRMDCRGGPGRPPRSPSLISLMVSVDVKHHVYLLTATSTLTQLLGSDTRHLLLSWCCTSTETVWLIRDGGKMG